jgi:hypothetical protein
MAPSIAPYFLGSNPSVITAYLGSKEDLELATFSLSSSGELTAELNLTWDAVSESAPFPSIFFIPDDNLAVVAEYGGNGQLDMNVFDQNGSVAKADDAKEAIIIERYVTRATYRTDGSSTREWRIRGKCANGLRGCHTLVIRGVAGVRRDFDYFYSSTKNPCCRPRLLPNCVIRSS